MNNRKIIASLTTGILVLGVGPIAIADDLGDALANCRSIESDGDRLACYDQLTAGAETKAVEEAAAAPVAAVEVKAAPEPVAQATPSPPDEPLPLTDDVAKQDVEGIEIERPEYQAMVARCQEARHEKRKYFIMENGQVWQQANSGRLRFRDKSCQFEVKLQKDYFGWVMDIPSEEREVRVKRVR